MRSKLNVAIAICLVLLSIFILVFLKQPKEANHNTLSNFEFVELIPIDKFFDHNAEAWGHLLSENGKWLAWRERVGSKIKLRYRAIESDFIHEITPSGPFLFSFDDVKQRLYLADGSGYWIIDPNHSQHKWEQIPINEISKAQLALMPNNSSPYWYFYSYDRSDLYADVYRYPADGGEGELVALNDGAVLEWGFSPSSEVAYRYRRLSNGNKSVERQDSGKWQFLIEVSGADEFRIAAEAKNNDTIWAISNRNRDKIAAVSLDPLTGEELVLYEHPDVDIHSFSLDVETLQPAYVTYYKPDFMVHSFNDRYRTLWQKLNSEEQVGVHLLSQTRNMIAFTAVKSAANIVPKTIFYDTTANTQSILSTHPLGPYEGILSNTKTLAIPTADGLTLTALLTLPKGAEGSPVPLVLMVHGGPALHDTNGFSAESQFLANRGYAVLRVNYRGSTGYGRQFKQAGFGEVAGKMQDDLDDAVRWVVDHGVADPKNIAIMGSSYGGFAALTGAWRNGSLYKAAIAHAAVTDMAYQTENHPAFWTLNLQNWTDYTGDPTDDAVAKKLRDISPVNHVSDFDIPILLMHNRDDPIVHVVQSEMLENKLNAAGKNVRAKYFVSGGHSAGYGQELIAFWREVELFLAEHLGGRAGGKSIRELVIR